MQIYQMLTQKSRKATHHLIETGSVTSEPVSVIYKRNPYEIVVHDFYLYDEIGHATDFVEMIDIIRSAGQHDRINIYFNTEGGDVNSGIALLSALAVTEATVTTILDSMACSMGAILFFAGHEHIIHESGVMMFHTITAEFGGKLSETEDGLKAFKQQYISILKSYCSDFLTAAEITQICNGKDLWFPAAVIKKRLPNSKYIKFRKPKCLSD